MAQATSTGTHAPARQGTRRPNRRPVVSSTAAKYAMALTGAVFALFVLVHMIGNLKVYQGPEHFNAYAHWLHTLLEPLLPYEGFLWIFRAFLLLCLVVHVGCATMLARRARAARGPRRRRGLRSLSSFTARTMLVTGVVLLLFVVFHVLDLTSGVGVASDGFRQASETQSYAYQNLVASFRRPGAALVYVVAMLCLFLHLAHGLWAAVFDLGFAVPRTAQKWVLLLSGLFGLVVMLGDITIPIAVLTGLVR